jgi:hypothetical protein
MMALAMTKLTKRNVHQAETNKPERGVFTLLDADADEAQIQDAVRVLLGLPPDYDFSDEAEAAWAAERTKAGPEASAKLERGVPQAPGSAGRNSSSIAKSRR